MELGRPARNQSSKKIRQPLKSLVFHVEDEKVSAFLNTHSDVIMDELNVKSVKQSTNSADLIIRIVRSFTHPYPCANLIWKKHTIKIEKAKVVNTTLKAKELKRIEPGKIISAEDNTINIKVDDEIIKLVSIAPIPDDLLSVKYIHPPSMYINKHNIRFD